MYVVGLTGGIGSGKTTVTDLFAALGIEIVDADMIARRLFEQGTEALQAVVARFGEQALLANGDLDRAWLRQRVFAHAEDKAWLNQLTHPMIRQQLLEQLSAAQSPYVILSAPLLLENGLQQLCQRVTVVDISEAQQLERTSKRDNVPPAHVQQVMAAQWSRAQRCAAADDVIDNSGSQEQLAQQVQRLHQDYLKAATEALQPPAKSLS